MLKSEFRMPKSEGIPKPDGGMELAAPTTSLDASAFELLSGFGFRISDFYSYVEVVEESRRGPQFLLELNEHALGTEDVGNFAVGVEDVAEFAGAHRANFQAGRITADPRALDAEMAFFHHALTPRPITQVGHVRIDLLFRNR